MNTRPAGRNHRQNQADRQATAARQAERLRTVTGYLAARVPGLDEQQAAALLDEVGSGHPRSVLQIADYLGRNPDPLAEPGPDLPAALRRVAFRLHADGHGFVVAPRCARCGKVSAHLPIPDPDGVGHICMTCHGRTRRAVCGICGIEKIVRSRVNGVLACSNCERRHGRQEECRVCSRTSPVAARNDDGTALCHRCAPRRLYDCHLCGQSRPAATVTADGATCSSCYRAPARRCGRCGQVRPVKKRADVTGPDLCAGCHRGPVATCSRCGRTRPCRYASSDAPLCFACVPVGTDRCHRCSQDRPICARWPIGAVCKHCYIYLRSHPQPCPGCAAVRPLIGIDPTGRTVCGPCVGMDVDHECRRCGTASTLNRGRCTACHLTDLLDELAATAVGKPNAGQVRALADALTKTDRPVTVLFWLRYSHSAKVFNQRLGSGAKLTHAALDDMLPAKPVHYIREVLVAADVLPTRDEHLERINAWLTVRLNSVEPPLAAVIRPYATWFLIHRTRRKHPDGQTPATTAASVRARINVAIGFLEDLHRQDTDIRQLTQPLLDAWLVANPARRTPIQPFIAWTNRHRLTRRLSVPGKPRTTPSTFLDEDELARQLAVCTEPGPMPLALRTAAALILLFGLPLSKILTLPRDAVREHGGNTLLHLGGTDIPLPPRIADLVLRLAAEAPKQTIVTGLEHDRPWLFPGKSARRPATPSMFHNGFARYGITAARGRNTAVRSLAADLPAPILANVTGLHINTATQWSHLVRRDAAAYIAARIQTTEQE